MHRLRNLEERLIAADDLPVGNEAEVVEQGDHGAEELRHSAAIRGSVDVDDPGAFQIACPANEFVKGGVRGDAPVSL